MEKFNTFVAERLWLQIALGLLGATAVIMLISPGQSLPAVLMRVAATSIGGVGVLAVVRRREKRVAGGSATGLVSLDRKLRRGEVPTDPVEREAMRELVTRRLHRQRHRVPATVFLGLLFGSVVALTAVTSGPRQVIGFALLFVICLSTLVVSGNRQNRRMRQMRDALGASPAAPSAEAGSPRRG